MDRGVKAGSPCLGWSLQPGLVPSTGSTLPSSSDTACKVHDHTQDQTKKQKRGGKGKEEQNRMVKREGAKRKKDIDERTEGEGWTATE